MGKGSTWPCQVKIGYKLETYQNKTDCSSYYYSYLIVSFGFRRVNWFESNFTLNTWFFWKVSYLQIMSLYPCIIIKQWTYSVKQILMIPCKQKTFDVMSFFFFFFDREIKDFFFIFFYLMLCLNQKRIFCEVI